MKSFLRWAGSKRQLVSELARYYAHGNGCYIEPFAGSSCLFFHLEPREAILGDLNGELIDTMRAIRNRPKDVLRCLGSMPTGKRAYYAVRSQDAESLSSIDAAARFIYLNHYCFNGLYRTNAAGRFNVPYGPPKSGASVNRDLIRNASRALKRATLVQSDFEETALRAKPGAFVYLDPPYAVSSRRVFSEYASDGFSLQDLERLGTVLSRLNQRNVTFLISYADSPEARELLRKWRPRRVRTRRNIAGFVGDRRHSYELLATNADTGADDAN
jgi:DNA adenine methylase